MMKNLILAILMTLSLGLFSPVVVQTAYAACPTTPTTAKEQVLAGAGTTGSDCSDKGVSSFISAVINILSYIVGVAAIIMIILSGMKYITSSGDAAKITSAKNTLIYALIGLIIAALAQLLVHFVLNAATNTCPINNHRSANGKLCIPD
jgi:hypothetical protein